MQETQELSQILPSPHTPYPVDYLLNCPQDRFFLLSHDHHGCNIYTMAALVQDFLVSCPEHQTDFVIGLPNQLLTLYAVANTCFLKHKSIHCAKCFKDPLTAQIVKSKVLNTV